jgi:hypothetical protein
VEANEATIDAGGEISITSTAGKIDYMTTSNATTVFFQSPVGTTSSVEYDDQNSAVLSLSGGNFNVEQLFNAVVYGAVNVTDLDITGAGLSTSSVTTLNAVTTGSLTVNLAQPLDLNGAITASGPVTIEDTAGNVTVGSGGSIDETGNGNSVIVAAGASSGFYFINNSSAGANAITGANYHLFSNDPTGDSFGGMTFSSDDTFYNATYPPSGLPAANTTSYYIAGPGPGGGAGVGSGGSGAVSMAGADTGSGSDTFPPSVTPQPVQTAPLTPPPPPANSNPPPPAYAGNGSAAQTGQQGSGFADSSGNGGQVAAGDTAQLNDGQLNTATNPAAAGALTEALGPAVHTALVDALGSLGDFTVDSDPAPDNGTEVADHHLKKHTGETTLHGGEVVSIGGDGVKNIPLNQAPKSLRDALADSALHGVTAGP